MRRGRLYIISMKKIFYKISNIFYTLFLFSAATLFAQTGSANLSVSRTGPYKVVDKSNWSRYENGKYIGHVYREVRASITPQPGSGESSLLYRGNFYVLEETLRDMVQSARGLDAVIPVTFEMFKSGGIEIDNDRGFPALRGFPSYPAGMVLPGTKWTAPGAQALDPLNTGRPVLVPFFAEYEYRGIETYREEPVHRIQARYAIRFRGDGEILTISGTHTVDILVRVSDGLPRMMRDSMDETYTFPDGKTLRFRGFTLSFGESSVPLDREAVIASIPRTDLEKIPPAGSGSGLEALPDIEVESVPEGIKLTLKDLRFAPDSDQLLPEEKPRLEQIAQVLKNIPGRDFLVEGHTASVGNVKGEMELSVQRAKKIVDELSARGIPPDRFIFKGWGGTKPVGDNGTDEGRKLNRRVEITILE